MKVKDNKHDQSCQHSSTKDAYLCDYRITIDSFYLYDKLGLQCYNKYIWYFNSI